MSTIERIGSQDWVINQYNKNTQGTDTKAIKQMKDKAKIGSSLAVQVEISPKAKNLAKTTSLNQGLAKNGTKIAMVLFCLMFTKPAKAIDDDKLAHFGISFAVSGLVYGLMSGPVCVDGRDGYTDCSRPLPATERAIIAFVTTTLIGVAKEAMDSANGGHFDMGDLGADMIGAGLGTLTFRLTFP